MQLFEDCGRITNPNVSLCPGRLLGDASLFITMAMCLSAFDISPATDDEGVPVIPEIDSKAGIVRSVVVNYDFLWTQFDHPTSALKDFELTLAPRLSVEQFNHLVRQQ